ncbi:hypothetical protein BDD12DRAFT_840816 [Trichophaea hybrida]|nr:hypothetical protein BDD12DRAFT_840816 [Trichophaea hybrida]
MTTLGAEKTMSGHATTAGSRATSKSTDFTTSGRRHNTSKSTNLPHLHIEHAATFTTATISPAISTPRNRGERERKEKQKCAKSPSTVISAISQKHDYTRYTSIWSLPDNKSENCTAAYQSFQNSTRPSDWSHQPAAPHTNSGLHMLTVRMASPSE